MRTSRFAILVAVLAALAAATAAWLFPRALPVVALKQSLTRDVALARADSFFRAHSLVKPSNDENNPFRLFAERFFEAATSTEPLNLEWQVRQVLRDKGAREK